MNPSDQITSYIDKLGDWRGKTVARLRTVIRAASPDLVEEWKWSTPVWSYQGNVVAVGAFQDHVKLNFRRHAVFNAGLDAKATRTIDLHEGDRLDVAALRDLVRAAVAVVLTGLVSLFLLIDGVARLAGFAPYVEGLTKFGYSPTLAPWIGLSLLVSTALYAVPRTMVFGAILVTGYLGGATATQLRVGDPRFLFPVALGVMAWAGLWCRSSQIRNLLPLRR